MFDKFLLWSVKNEYIILTRFALWIGANPNAKDKDGNTLLHILVDSKNIKTAEKIADILLKKGTNIHATNNARESSLTYAARKSNFTITKYLASKDQDPKHRELLKDTLIKLAYLRRSEPTLREERKSIISTIAIKLKSSYTQQENKETLKIFIKYMNQILPILEAPKGLALKESECPMLNIINDKLGDNIKNQHTEDLSIQSSKRNINTRPIKPSAPEEKKHGHKKSQLRYTIPKAKDSSHAQGF